MSVLPILNYPAPTLRAVAEPVADTGDDLRQLVADMFDTLYAAGGRGLAAPQVGVLSRVFVMDLSWKHGTPDPRVCINPEIVEVGGVLESGEEGCLSIPGVPCMVTRPTEVLMAWTGMDGNRRRERLYGFAARCALHELDHLDGRLCIDHLDDAGRAAIAPALEALAAA